ncbi:chemotaxis protein CheW [Desulfovulcanus sp.]
MDNLLAEFINETRDLIQDASQDFLQIEENPEDKDLINSLFRVMHTIKGSSGLFDIAPLTELVHEAENILDQARDGEIILTPEIIDIFLDILDQINVWLDELETSEHLGEDAADLAQELKDKLHNLTGSSAAPDKSEQNIPDQKNTEQQSVSQEKNKDILPLLKVFSHQSRLHILEQQPEAWDENIFLIHYQPDPNCFFSGDDPLLTVRKTPSLLALALQPIADWPAKENFDPFTCNLEFYVLSIASRDELEEHFAYVADEITIYPIKIMDLIFPVGEPVNSEALELFLNDAQKLLAERKFAELLNAVQVALELAPEKSWQYTALQLLELCLKSRPTAKLNLIKALINAIATSAFTIEPEPPLPPQTEVSADKPEPGRPKQPAHQDNAIVQQAREILSRQLMLLTLDCEEGVKQGQLTSLKTVINNILLSMAQPDLQKEIMAILTELEGSYSPDKAARAKDKIQTFFESLFAAPATPEPSTTSTPATSSAPATTPSTTSKSSPPRPPAQMKTDIKVLKIDQKRIDVLMDLVSELVVAKNALPYLARKAEEIFHSRELGRELKTQYATINRICEELQNAVMQIRMVPVSHIFQRFPRLVRDIARKLNKKVKLIIQGEDTRADKNVIEDMAEPLIHLIRNSLDHGLETPETRKQAGKPEEGHLYLTAKHLEDQIIIEVRDDGRGIDVQAVKQKAYEKGIIDEETLESLSHQDALQLIFAPGLSTAREISDVSGRGVGMDAVRAMVENVGGSVNISSEPGKGTTVSLSLPLSMAVTRILMIEVAGELFGVPIENVAETVRIHIDEIHHIKDMEAIVLRERLIPLYRLKEILRLHSPTKQQPDSQAMQDDEIAVLIITLGRHEFGLVVDKFHEGIDIILKPLEGMMEQFRLYSGATLLGDGRVLLVLNPKEIVQWL